MSTGRGTTSLTLKRIENIQNTFFDALDEALQDGDTIHLDRIIDANPSLSLVNMYLNRKIIDSKKATKFYYLTPLHYVIQKFDAGVIKEPYSSYQQQVVRYLLNKGANPNRRAQEVSPLDVALKRNNDKVIEALSESPDIDFSTSHRIEFFGAGKKDLLRGTREEEDLSLSFGQFLFLKCTTITFSIDAGGFCFGFYIKARESFLKREQDDFNKKIIFLHQFFMDLLEEIKAELKLKNIAINENIFIALDDPLMQREIPEKLIAKIKEHDEKNEFKISNFLKSICDFQTSNLKDTIDYSYRGILATGAYIGLDSLCIFYRLLREKVREIHAADPFENPIVFYLPMPTHASFAGYDPVADKFSWMDANFFPIRTYDPNSNIELLNLCRMTMVSTSMTSSETAIFSTILSSSNQDADRANRLAENIKNDKQWQELHTVTREKAQIHSWQRKQAGYKESFFPTIFRQPNESHKNPSLRKVFASVGDVKGYELADLYPTKEQFFKRKIRQFYGSSLLSIILGGAATFFLTMLIIKGVLALSVVTFGAPAAAVGILLFAIAAVLIIQKINSAYDRKTQFKEEAEVFKHKPVKKRTENENVKEVANSPVKKATLAFFSLFHRKTEPNASRPMQTVSFSRRR